MDLLLEELLNANADASAVHISDVVSLVAT